MMRIQITLILFLAILMASLLPGQEKGVNKTKNKIMKLYREYQRSFPTAPEIFINELDTLSPNSFIFLDVREAKEIAVSKIPGAISLTQFNSNMKQFQHKKIIVYCTIGYRSGLQTVQLKEINFDAYNLVGGVLSWAGKGNKFESSNYDSLTVHVYGKKWNLLPPGYKGIW